MEPILSSNRRDEAALLGMTSCPLKVTEDIWFGCCSCTYFTRDQHGIVSHLVAHGDGQVKCQPPSAFPASKFKVHSNAQKHRRVKLFECKLCPHVFTRNSSLIEHNRTHSGEKPYKCKLCSKAFAHRGSLNHHKKTHSGDKPYKCELCAKAFAISSSLICHKKTHTGEKPFKCSLCPQEFAHKNGLIHHKQTHTGVKPFKCELCPQEFTHSPQEFTHISSLKKFLFEKP
uniref:Putative regulation of transcription n=1 Tax=Ixodes ricinus TaxID=34613 RepID=A0A6B0V3C9_IXORI